MPTKHRKETVLLTEAESERFRRAKGDLSLSNFLRAKLGLQPFRLGAPKGKRQSDKRGWERDEYSQG